MQLTKVRDHYIDRMSLDRSCFQNPWVLVFLQCRSDCLLHWFVCYRLVDLLPAANRLILRHLLCVLLKISASEKINRMTPRNLALTVGQSMLYRPIVDMTSATQLSLLQHDTKEVVPVLFTSLIENATTIFGEDVTQLFGSSSERETSKLT